MELPGGAYRDAAGASCFLKIILEPLCCNVQNHLGPQSLQPDTRHLSIEAEFLFRKVADMLAKSNCSAVGQHMLVHPVQAADSTSSSGSNGSAGGCDFEQHACGAGSVCIGHHATQQWPESAGRCAAATARYVPSLSTHLR